VTLPVIDVMRDIWPHNPIWTGTRRELLPARHGLNPNSEQVIDSGDARSPRFDAVPTPRSVGSHRQSSPRVYVNLFP
jgi:hypothetical protein